jgi:hypothetical protein
VKVIAAKTRGHPNLMNGVPEMAGQSLFEMGNENRAAHLVLAKFDRIDRNRREPESV